jgi:hypothetical protein
MQNKHRRNRDDWKVSDEVLDNTWRICAVVEDQFNNVLMECDGTIFCFFRCLIGEKLFSVLRGHHRQHIADFTSDITVTRSEEQTVKFVERLTKRCRNAKAVAPELSEAHFDTDPSSL